MIEYQSLKGKKGFREVLKRGRRYYEREIQLIVYQRHGLEDLFNKNNTPIFNKTEVGIQIQKKYGNAVARNKAKRRIRCICRELLGVEDNFYIIIRPLEHFKYLKYDDSRKIFMFLFKKAGVLRPL